MNDTRADRPLEIAVTIDDFVLWDGVPMPDDTTPTDITRSVAKTLNDYGLKGPTASLTHTGSRTSQSKSRPSRRGPKQAITWVTTLTSMLHCAGCPTRHSDAILRRPRSTSVI